jgi:hypothetical protein
MGADLLLIPQGIVCSFPALARLALVDPTYSKFTGAVMKILVSLLIFAVVWNTTTVASTAGSVTYEWTDDQGTVIFSDNPNQIPNKYIKKVKTRGSVKGEKQQLIFDEPSNLKQSQPKRTEEVYGGHDEKWWRGQFSGARSEINNLKVELEGKRQTLKSLHYKKVISNSSQTEGIFGNPRKNRENYRQAYEEICNDEERIKVLEQKLIDLEYEAARNGVPLDWRS